MPGGSQKCIGGANRGSICSPLLLAEFPPYCSSEAYSSDTFHGQSRGHNCGNNVTSWFNFGRISSCLCTFVQSVTV